MTIEPERAVLKYQRATAALIFAAVFSTLFFMPFSDNRIRLICGCVLGGLFLLVAFIFLPLNFKRYIIKVSKSGIYCRKGLIFSREYFFPAPKLVYIRVMRFPLQSCFGLCTPVLRGVGKDVVLPLLTLRQVQQIKELSEYDR